METAGKMPLRKRKQFLFDEINTEGDDDILMELPSKTFIQLRKALTMASN